VTRVEEWCVEAESAEEARELLASGRGRRMHIGHCVNLEIERVEDEAA
jgi:xanthine/CO dehydrogenase XdhC/CoxF family maturation factor